MDRLAGLLPTLPEEEVWDSVLNRPGRSSGGLGHACRSLDRPGPAWASPRLFRPLQANQTIQAVAQAIQAMAQAIQAIQAVAQANQAVAQAIQAKSQAMQAVVQAVQAPSAIQAAWAGPGHPSPRPE